MPTPQNGQHTQTIRRLLPTNCLSVFDCFVGLVLKGLSITSGLVLLYLTVGYMLSHMSIVRSSRLDRLKKKPGSVPLNKVDI